MQEAWNEFLETLIQQAFSTYPRTLEAEQAEEKREQIEARINEKYDTEDKKAFYDMLFEIGVDAERKNNYFYHCGMRDCIVILKKLGVLA